MITSQLGQNQLGQTNPTRQFFLYFVGRVGQKIKNLFGKEFTPKTQEFNHVQYKEYYNRGTKVGWILYTLLELLHHDAILAC